MTSDLTTAVQALRDRRNAPPPFCPGAIGAKPHSIERCPACRMAKRTRAHYDREHPPVPLGGPPEILDALADLLDEIASDAGDDRHRLNEIRAAAVALASAILHTDQHDSEGK